MSLVTESTAQGFSRRATQSSTLAVPMGVLMERKIFDAVFAPEAPVADFARRGGAIAGRRPEIFVSSSEDLVMSRASVDEVAGREAELTMPVGVLYGAEDAILDPDLHGRAFSEKAGAELTMLPGRGHMIPFTAPEECADFIRKMAARV